MPETQPTPLEVIKRANELQDSLSAFARADHTSRTSQLRPLVDLIMETNPETKMFENVNADTMRHLVDTNNKHAKEDFQPKLEQAIQKTLQTPLKGKEGTPWTGGYTIVGVDSDGNILAAASQITPELKEKYGDNFYPFALLKAVLRQYLENPDVPSELDDPTNFKLLETLGLKPFEELFIGSTRPAKLGDKLVYWGTSACSAEPSYRSEFLGMLKGEPEPEQLAGRFDTIFADILKMYLYEPKRNVQPIEMPEHLAQWRIEH